ncbi:MAG TPA: hypothetical protein DFI01_10905 [Bacteroidales bacterium]|nr:hypothetical protein [Bacteroidales bacterium]
MFPDEMVRFLIISLLITLHPVHVTLLGIDYSPEKDIFNATLKVYYDDFILDYELLTGNKPTFNFSDNNQEVRKLISIYIKEKIVLAADNKILNFTITGINLEDNELTVKMEYKNNPSSLLFRIKNSILADIYNDQSNLIIFRYGDFEEGVKLTPEKREYIFSITKDS